MFVTIAIGLTGAVYLRGWLAIRQTRPAEFTLLRLGYFLSGLAVLWVALGALDDLADELLSVHMVQHLLLLSVVPPLLLLGWPVIPLLRGLPAPLRLSAFHRVWRWLTSPPVAWITMNAIFLAWHVPAAYDFALDHEYVHRFEHVCFLLSSLAFWWCIVQPWPGGWGFLPYLIGADLVNTAVSAFLAFCDRPVYTYYLAHPAPYPISPLSDQVLGAVIMWVGGSFAFLIPAAWMTFRRLQPTFSQSPDLRQGL
jgi:cytochrome c oxidase assembly factor CtaG